ncbi:recombinase family protein [Cryobacterium sp. M25]|uniref:recombinase family protein n=1 Tax=Cryobacterium sp. M25 TaxID=2048293 RepID=UPI00130483FD|nr:recombinase family protein [Cryobacterium sp. M25]
MSVSSPPRAALYCRISEKKKKKEGEDEAHDSVAVQEKRLRKLAKTEGYFVQEVFVDDGVSAYSGAVRKEWLRLLKDMKAKKFDVILAVAEDRLARNSFELTGLQRDCISAGVTWQTIASGKVDPSTAEGGLMSTITGAVAQYESSIKKERLRARFEDEISQGNALWGTRPFGYTSAREGALIPEEQTMIVAAYETILTGGTLYEIAKRWNVAGVKTTRGNEWSYQTVRQLLLRPRNAGLVVRDGAIQEGITGRWEPLVSRETLSDTTSILTASSRRTAPGRKASYLCSGLVRCGVCGSPMRSHTVKVDGIITPHYRCASKLRVSTDPTRHTAVRVEQLDALVRNAIVSAFLFGTGNLVPSAKGIDMTPLHKAQALVRASRDEFKTLIRLGALTAAEVAKDLLELNKNEDIIIGQLQAAAQESAHAAMMVDLRQALVSGPVHMAATWAAKDQLAEKFDTLPLGQQRELVASLLDITVNKGRKAERIEIIHKVVLSLNAPEEPWLDA